jgi:hypothetical protein
VSIAPNDQGWRLDPLAGIRNQRVSRTTTKAVRAWVEHAHAANSGARDSFADNYHIHQH